VAALALPSSCTFHDPAKELEVTVVETYWIVDSPQAGQNYIAPAVRFHIRNIGRVPLHSVQARARFAGTVGDEPWGSIQEQVSTWKQPLLPGKEALVTVRSNGRYASPADPPDMLRSPGFRDATAEIFVRIGPSKWAMLATAPVERRIGAKAVQDLAAP
jgi:hypothetical protein